MVPQAPNPITTEQCLIAEQRAATLLSVPTLVKNIHCAIRKEIANEPAYVEITTGIAAARKLLKTIPIIEEHKKRQVRYHICSFV